MNSTSQQKMSSLLSNVSIPHKEVHCYGRQIVVTCWGIEAAKQYGALLSKAGLQVKKIIKTIDRNIVNKNTILKPSTHTVYRVFATV
jgi:hypothetical protein